MLVLITLVILVKSKSYCLCKTLHAPLFCILPLYHFVPSTTLIFFLFLEHGKFIISPGPLHLLFPRVEYLSSITWHGWFLLVVYYPSSDWGSLPGSPYVMFPHSEPHYHIPCSVFFIAPITGLHEGTDYMLYFFTLVSLGTNSSCAKLVHTIFIEQINENFASILASTHNSGPLNLSWKVTSFLGISWGTHG